MIKIIKIGEHICILKTHIDIIDDFSQEFLIKLKDISKKYNFLLFEDRKFADIGNTVKLQYQCQHYEINKYFDVINCHIFPGPKIVDGLYEGLDNENLDSACLLLAEMSSEGNLFDISPKVKQVCLETAKKWPNYIAGFICQSKIDDTGKFLHFTPGVSVSNNSK